MTQRVDLWSVLDRLAVDSVVTDYAAAVDDGDWAAYRQLFAPGGRADYRSAGGIEGDAVAVSEWLAQNLEQFGVRQHLIVNRQIRLQANEHDNGDTARVRADYVNPMRLDRPDGAAAAPDFLSGGRYTFGLVRVQDDWQLRQVVINEKWRTTG